MSKMKSSLLESILVRKQQQQQQSNVDNISQEDQQHLIVDETANNTKQATTNLQQQHMNNLTKFLQNIVDFNSLNQYNNAAAMAAVAAAAASALTQQQQQQQSSKTIDGAEKVVKSDPDLSKQANSEDWKDNNDVEDDEELLIASNDVVVANKKISEDQSKQSDEYNRKYSGSAFQPLKFKSPKTTSSDEFESSFKEEAGNNYNDDEEVIGAAGNDYSGKDNLEEDLEDMDDDMRSRTSSARSFQCRGDSQSPSFQQLSNKYLYSAAAINPLMIESHLRGLAAQSPSQIHQHYQAIQQSLQRNLSFYQATSPLNSGSSMSKLATGGQQSMVNNSARRKRSKDFSSPPTSSTPPNFPAASTSASIQQPTTPENQNGDGNQIRFSTEIWRCPYCCYETTSASRYNSHLVCHGWKPYLCPHCGSRSNRLPDMRTHISTFHPEFNVNTFVVLNEEEAKSTLKDYMKNRALINRKLKEMRPQPKFKCKLCPYASLYQFNLTKHVKSVHISEFYQSNAAAANSNNANNSNPSSQLGAVNGLND